MDPVKDVLSRPAFWYLLLILAAAGWVGTMDFADAAREGHYYCEMVATGAWPDYAQSYPANCVELGYPAVPRLSGDTN